MAKFDIIFPRNCNPKEVIAMQGSFIQASLIFKYKNLLHIWEASFKKKKFPGEFEEC